jgi:hypothetical protein
MGPGNFDVFYLFLHAPQIKIARDGGASRSHTRILTVKHVGHMRRLSIMHYLNIHGQRYSGMNSELHEMSRYRICIQDLGQWT